ncbi:hypothetical protein ACH5RR_012579 [Cinchona calisaya]|uniref:Uncharacterized protein n=1 Tax=Cinchona calisaya TaxID=153742 RepID=A0ABD3A8P4_9GENT
MPHHKQTDISSYKGMVFVENMPLPKQTETFAYEGLVTMVPIDEIVDDQVFQKPKNHTEKQAQSLNVAILDSLSDSEKGDMILDDLQQEPLPYSSNDSSPRNSLAIPSSPVTTTPFSQPDTSTSQLHDPNSSSSPGPQLPDLFSTTPSPTTHSRPAVPATVTPIFYDQPFPFLTPNPSSKPTMIYI